jgi:uncharacterized protein YegP (UPF0339 family)
MKIEYYMDAQGEWRWTLKARNGNIIADGAEGYSSKGGVVRALKGFFKGMKTLTSKPLAAKLVDRSPEAEETE